LEYFGFTRTFPVSEIDGEYAVNFGVVALTEVGRQLAGIAGAEPVEGFLDFLEAEWSKAGIWRRLPVFGKSRGGIKTPGERWSGRSSKPGAFSPKF
jgi:hypothetical protein